MSLTTQLALNVKGLSVTRQDAMHEFTVSLPSLELRAGNLLALTGQSGSGKSTLLEVIGLILKPNELERFELALNKGEPAYDIANEVLQKKENQLADIRAQALGFVLQNGGLLPFLSIRDNVYLARVQKGLSSHADWIDEVMVRLNIAHLVDKKPHQLSIGERQRVAFIRSFAHEPAIILADEPTAALDPYTAETLFGIMRELTQELKLSILLVSHDWRLIDKHGIDKIQGRTVNQNRSLFEYA